MTDQETDEREDKLPSDLVWETTDPTKDPLERLYDLRNCPRRWDTEFELEYAVDMAIELSRANKAKLGDEQDALRRELEELKDEIFMLREEKVQRDKANLEQRRKDFEAGIQTAFKSETFAKFLGVDNAMTCEEFRDGIWQEYLAKEQK